jgi:hypothetical protein
VEHIRTQKKEELRKNELLEAAVNAVIGIGSVNIVKLGTQLVLKKFNPTRELKRDVINSISKDLTDGSCRASLSPLVAAIDPACIDTRTLVNVYNTTEPTPSLSDAGFLGSQPEIFILAGFHRVTAVRETMCRQMKKLEGLRKELKDIQEEIKEDKMGDDYDGKNSEAKNNPAVDALIQEIRVTEKILQGMQVWPIWFYNLGRFPCCFEEMRPLLMNRRPAQRVWHTDVTARSGGCVEVLDGKYSTPEVSPDEQRPTV